MISDQPDTPAGGDPACWLNLVCEECGAVTSEGHRPGCSSAARVPAADFQLAGWDDPAASEPGEG